MSENLEILEKKKSHQTWTGIWKIWRGLTARAQKQIVETNSVQYNVGELKDK